MNDRRSTPTWQWIAGLSVGIVIAVAGYAYTDTQKKIEKLQDTKVDESAFLRAMDKVDRQYEKIGALLREHEMKAARRRGD